MGGGWASVRGRHARGRDYLLLLSVSDLLSAGRRSSRNGMKSLSAVPIRTKSYRDASHTLRADVSQADRKYRDRASVPTACWGGWVGDTDMGCSRFSGAMPD